MTVSSWLDGRRRRITLALVGVVHAAMTVQLLTGPERLVDPGVAILHELLPTPVRAALWGSMAVIMLITAGHERWEPIGWLAAMVMPLERAVSYGWSGLMWLIPGWPPGAAASWGASLLYLGLAGILYVVATWEERPVWRSGP